MTAAHPQCPMKSWKPGCSAETGLHAQTCSRIGVHMHPPTTVLLETPH